MDTRNRTVIKSEAEVEALLLTIKTKMPLTYAAVKAKAQAVGGDAYAWVRQGLRGAPDCFYAVEVGHAVGTPFERGDVMAELRRWQRLYGDVTVCFFATEGVF
jgi:hypothetical protein